MQLWEMDPDGNGKVQVSDVDGGINSFLYSPDGEKILLTMDVKLDKTPQEVYPDLPLTSQVDNRSLHRLAEGIRVLQYAPQAKLVLTGGRGFDPVPNARIVARLAKLFGVPSARIVVRTSPSSTVEEAQAIKPLVGSTPFILVTTASHMPRAVAVFEKQGMRPIAAPADHELKQAPGSTADMFFPDSTNLAMTHTAVYELLGLAWYRLRGYI